VTLRPILSNGLPFSGAFNPESALDVQNFSGKVGLVRRCAAHIQLLFERRGTVIANLDDKTNSCASLQRLLNIAAGNDLTP
jgi:hypothetical protein